MASLLSAFETRDVFFMVFDNDRGCGQVSLVNGTGAVLEKDFDGGFDVCFTFLDNIVKLYEGWLCLGFQTLGEGRIFKTDGLFTRLIVEM